MNNEILQYQEIIDFWFFEISPKQHFKKDHQFDTEVKNRFEETLLKVANGEAWSWRKNGFGRLAEIIVLDQFPRNIYRHSAQSFAFDKMALVLAQEAISLKADEHFSTTEKVFLYMPFMHSESTQIHQHAINLFSQKGLEDNLKFELRHKQIIDQFGRYPHRNDILSRESTAEEIEFLKQPGSGF